MKKSLLLKSLAAILLFVSIIVSVVSGLTVYMVLESGAQFDGGRDITESAAGSILSMYIDEIAEHYYLRINGNISKSHINAFDYRFSESRTNIRYRVTAGDVVTFDNIPQDYEKSMYYMRDTARGYVNLGSVESKSMSLQDEKAVDALYESILRNYDIIEWNVTFDDEKEFLKYRVDYEIAPRQHSILIVEVGIPMELQPVDYIYWVFLYISASVMYYEWFIAVSALCAVIAVICAVHICVSAGHRKKCDDIRLGFFARLPLEIYLALLLGVCALTVFMIEEFYSVLIYAAAIILVLITFIGVLFSVSARLKSKGWYKNSIIIKLLLIVCKYILKPIFKAAKRLFIMMVKIHLYWKTAVVSLVFFILYFAAAWRIHYGGLPFMIIIFICHMTLLVKFISDLKKLEATGEQIKDGNVKASIDGAKLLPSLRHHAESLNSIGAGVDKAVQQSVKSERMKTELITNVSHDIKTPLTSIINYVNLLKQEGLDAEKAPEYLDVLDRQSARLKKMTEDLVEASKAASGTLSFTPEETDVNIILSQALGEYEEKLTNRSLNVVVRKDDNVSTVYADGKLMWRIFDNVLSNICKYALEGTRIFIDITRNGDKVQTVFKNVSSEPLDVSAEELMERFVRGDSSRNTEGSGLGLSIAKSLAELQGGSFNIEIDGDLFKSTIIYPVK